MQHKDTKLFLIKMVHFSVALAAFACMWFWFRYRGFPKSADPGFRYNYFVILGYGAAAAFLSRVYNVYLLGYSGARSLLSAQAVTQALCAAFVYFAISIGWNRFRPPWPFIALLIVQTLWDALWIRLAEGVYFRMNPPKRTIFIYRNPADRGKIASVVRKMNGRLYRIEKELEYDGSFLGLREQLDGFEAILVAGVNSRCRNGILKYCQEKNVPGFFLPHVGDMIMQQARHIQAFDSPVMYVGRKRLNPEYALAKRAFDLLASCLGLAVFSPVLLLTGLAIRLYDGGPVIYRQVRLTKDGREFVIMKFRSMRVDAEKNGEARLSSGDSDSRVTPVGRVIRKYRIDELPQLLNILRGDMSFVGPRPERPEIAEQYRRAMPDFDLRLQVKAGLTGYAQVYGKYNTGPYEKLEFDLLYIRTMSLLTDLKLLLITLPVLFRKESTEGVPEGSTTAIEPGDANKEKQMNAGAAAPGK